MAPEPLRVLVVGIAWPPEMFLRRLLDGLAARGTQVTLGMPKPPDAGWLRQPNRSWMRMPAAGETSLPRGLRRSRTPGKVVAKVWQALRQPRGVSVRGYDVLYFPWNSAAIAHLDLFDQGVPVVLSCRGAQVNIAPHDPERAGLRDGLKTSFARAAAVHCVSEAILREAQLYGLDARKASVIHPAVDPQFFTPVGQRLRGDGVFRVISTGALIWRKGYEDALQAMRLLKDSGVPLTYEIIGEGPEKDRVLYTIDDLGLQNCVRLHGQRSPQSVRAHLQQADAYLLSSLSEGISNAALEAMACALPVVSSDCGGMREAIEHGSEGWIVPLRDPAGMAEALRQIYTHPQSAQAVGLAARQRILRDFSLDQQITRFQSLFSKAKAGA